MDSPTSSATVFNNTQSKNIYLKLIELHYLTSMIKEKRKSIHLAKDSVQQIKLLSFENKKIQPNGRDMYKITMKDGRNIATIQDKDDIEREIMPFSGIYDVLMELHVDNNHEITAIMKSATEIKYLIPNICFNLIPDACNICRATKTSGASRNGIVSFIHNIKLQEHTSNYNSIMIYLDEYSEYIVVRPTKSCDHIDICTELFKFFMEFGPPEKVCIILKDSELFDSISSIMENLCPTCEVTFKYEDDYQILLFRVMKAIGDWMKEADSDSWEMGCFVVQRRLNTMAKISAPSKIPLTAHNLFFNHSSIVTSLSEFTSTIELTSTVDAAESDTEDEPLIFVKEKNVTEEDPLSIEVSNLNIQDVAKRRSTRGNKTIRCRDVDATAFLNKTECDKVKMRLNKNKKIKSVKPSHEIPMINRRRPIKNRVLNEINEDTEIRKKKGKDAEGRVTAQTEAITIEITDIIEITEREDQASTSESGKTMVVNLDEEDSDDIAIDFGAEIYQE